MPNVRRALMLPEDLWNELKEMCGERNQTCSEFIVACVIQEIKRNPDYPMPKERAKKIIKEWLYGDTE